MNEYSLSGGIGFHKDGVNFKPKAAIISLLTPCLIHFIPETKTEKDVQDRISVLLEPNSLFVFHEDLYEIYKHGILCEQQEEFGNVANSEFCQTVNSNFLLRSNKRYSLTMRCVSKIMYTMSSPNEVLPPHMQEERERRLKWWQQAVNETK